MLLAVAAPGIAEIVFGVALAFALLATTFRAREHGQVE